MWFFFTCLLRRKCRCERERKKWNVHCKLEISFFFCKFHFRDYSRTTIDNFRSKFAREPTYFQEFLDPNKKKRATSINYIWALALLRYLERTAASIHFVYEIRAPATTATLKTRCHNALQAIDFQFSTLCSREICHASKPFDGQLALLGKGIRG